MVIIVQPAWGEATESRFWWNSGCNSCWGQCTSRCFCPRISKTRNGTARCFCPRLCSTRQWASTATVAQVSQKETRMRRASDSCGTKISSDREQWTTQRVRGKQPHGLDQQVTSRHVPLEQKFRGQRIASHNSWKPGSLFQNKKRSRSGFWKPVPWFEGWESLSDQAIDETNLSKGLVSIKFWYVYTYEMYHRGKCSDANRTHNRDLGTFVLR